MATNMVAIGHSTKSTAEEAIKEVSLEVKRDLKSAIGLALVFFTPHYNPSHLREMLEITLRPKNVFGIQSPLLIFEGKTLHKGVTACCFAQKNFDSQQIIVKERSIEFLESIFRKLFVSLPKRKNFAFVSLSPRINTKAFLRCAELSFGKTFRTFGSGFIKKYGIKNFQMVNNTVDEGAASVIVSGPFTTRYIKISGFLPLGRPFTITKAMPERNVIMEINHKPAAEIYRKYLEEKFDLFKKTSLGASYPLGIKIGNVHKIVSVLDFLDDESLLCIGDFREGMKANIMIATASSLLDEVEEKTYALGKERYEVAFIVNTFARKNILGLDADKELKKIKQGLGPQTKMIGYYCDYQLFPESALGKIIVENHHLCMVLLNYGDT